MTEVLLLWLWCKLEPQHSYFISYLSCLLTFSKDGEKTYFNPQGKIKLTTSVNVLSFPSKRVYIYIYLNSIPVLSSENIPCCCVSDFQDNIFNFWFNGNDWEKYKWSVRKSKDLFSFFIGGIWNANTDLTSFLWVLTDFTWQRGWQIFNIESGKTIWFWALPPSSAVLLLYVLL